jgi:hypothetical protein
VSLRARAGRAYAGAYHRLAPRSVRAAGRLPRLPREPLSRRFGLDRGRPVDRVYIERFLEAHAADVRGRVLEIYEPTYTRRFGGERVARADVLDVQEGAPHATLQGDLETGRGVPRSSFDCFICTQTLSLIYDLPAAARHAREALVPGGVLLLTVPGISQRSLAGEGDFPDLWRFTSVGLERLIVGSFGPSDVEVSAWGNPITAAAFLYGLAEHEVDPAAFTWNDPEYELVVAARAVRR